MKTKKFFMLLAVVLLSGASAFAQSESETLKGDVNEDGVVDVADINAVIEIMKAGGGTGEPTVYYFYVGTTKPTSLSQATIVSEYPAEQTYTNNSGAKAKIYVLTNSDKTVTMIDPGLGGIIDQDDVDISTIPGYKIFSTYSRWANGSPVLIRIS